MKTIGIVTTAAAFLMSAGVVFAEDGGGSPGTSGKMNPEDLLRKEQTAKESRKKLEDERGSDRLASTSRKESDRGEEHRALVASSTARFHEIREEMKDRLEELHSKAEKKISDLKDKQKQELAQRLATQFDQLNQTWTNKFKSLLDHYDVILDKIRSRALIAEGAGKDISETTTAIGAAEDAILAARTAVTEQTAKTYTLDTSTITTTTATSTPTGQDEITKGLRVSFQTLHKKLFADLFALRDGPMKNARKAVQAAAETLGKIPGVDDDHPAPTATTTVPVATTTTATTTNQ